MENVKEKNNSRMSTSRERRGFRVGDLCRANSGLHTWIQVQSGWIKRTGRKDVWITSLIVTEGR
jgi:hypothetical protein